MIVSIVHATPQDFEGIWEIFSKTIKTGDTYIYPPNTTQKEARKIWLDNTHAYVAKEDGKIVGTFVIRDNKTGLGSHICNAGFMVHPDHRGKGIGRQMGEFALKEAKKHGYLAMQFNVVVSTNFKSIALWKSLGFELIGTVPKGFNHLSLGLVDIHIMYKKL
jgi:L-amino acid N-acyltransferase YncA